jgi:hypothetical protein
MGNAAGLASLDEKAKGIEKTVVEILRHSYLAWLGVEIVL